METARKTFEINNGVKEIDPIDSLYLYSKEEEKVLVDQEPWKTDPKYFHTVKISAVALVKMVIHARSGGDYEIMGVMYGKVRDGVFWIMDAAALPVDGTETRVNAGNQADEYMVQYQESSGQIGKNEMQRGWYHSHPGYGCWLSGIDVDTESNYQRYNDPYLAVVIDPNRTVSAGKVEIGAFRTYPEGYTPPSGSSSEYQSIPMNKIEDFGVHADRYYQLKVEIYKTKTEERLLELLWNKYWVATLSQSLILSNQSYATDQVLSLNDKIKHAASNLQPKSGAQLKLVNPPPGQETGPSKGKGKSKNTFVGVEDEQTELSKAAKDAQAAYSIISRAQLINSARIATEAHNGMTTQIIKDRLFNTPLGQTVDIETARRAAAGSF